MPDLRDGQTAIARGSSGTPYEIKNVGGVYSCSCPGWRNQSRNPNYRTCKHLLDYRGDAVEASRIFPAGLANMPGTITGRVERHWPASGAGRAADIASGRLPAPGGRAVKFEPTTTVRIPAKPPAAPKVPHNAWTALLDDAHPLAEPLPPTPVSPAPANDSAVARGTSSDEPDWSGLHAELHAPPGTPLPAPLVEPVAIHAGGKGELKVLLAHPWDGARNVTGWFMSEKLDGVRAYWDGANFLSRNGNVFEAPDWYRDRMPKGVHLDGELWMGRGRFQETSGYVRRMDKGERWRDITYQVFDAPSVKGTFVERMAAIGRDFMLPAHCTKLQHDVVESHDHLRSFVAGIEALGGEGGMVRDPKSLYVRGRHESLLKVKSFFETEAVIVGHEPGKGRHKGAVGAYNCLIPEDVTLRAGGKVCHLKKLTKVDVGTGQSDADRKLDNPRGGIGNRITFCFQELSTTGVPRFPSFKGFRDYE